MLHKGVNDALNVCPCVCVCVCWRLLVCLKHTQHFCGCLIKRWIRTGELSPRKNIDLLWSGRQERQNREKSANTLVCASLSLSAFDSNIQTHEKRLSGKHLDRKRSETSQGGGWGERAIEFKCWQTNSAQRVDKPKDGTKGGKQASKHCLPNESYKMMSSCHTVEEENHWTQSECVVVNSELANKCTRRKDAKSRQEIKCKVLRLWWSASLLDSQKWPYMCLHKPFVSSTFARRALLDSRRMHTQLLRY